MKKFTSTFLAIIMLFSIMMVQSNAIAFDENSTTNLAQVEIPILTVPENISEEDAIAYVQDNGTRGFFIDGGATYALIRKSNDPEKCDLVINWSGELASAFRCKKVEIKSTSFLFPKTYDESGDGVTYVTKTFVASTLATAVFGEYEIPSDVEKATVYVTSGQIYILSNSSWASAAKTNYTTDIED